MAAFLLPASALADTAGDMIKSRELSQIISTAGICGYAIDQAKAAEIVSTALTAMEPTARSMFQMSGEAHKGRLERASELERKVMCETQAKLAVQYGLTP